MTAAESKKLHIGDRVRWSDPAVDGTVIDTGYHAIIVKWDDGQTGTTDHRDAQGITRIRGTR